MVEPTNFNELYTDSKDLLDNYGKLDALCNHTMHINRFTPNFVKRLSNYKEMLDKAKDTIAEQLEAIQRAFDTLETNIIIYFHNHKRTQEELLKLARDDKPEEEPLEKPEEPLDPIIKVDNAEEFKKEMNDVVEYLGKLGY